MSMLQRCGLAAALVCLPWALWAQDVVTVGDLLPRSPVVLTGAELQVLMPGISMSRVNEKGSTHHWTNEPGGEMVVSSDNQGRTARASTARGRWHLSEDGRYCLSIEWKRGETEEGCKLIVKAGDDYYAVEQMEPATRKAQRLGIRR